MKAILQPGCRVILDGRILEVGSQPTTDCNRSRGKDREILKRMPMNMDVAQSMKRKCAPNRGKRPVPPETPNPI